MPSASALRRSHGPLRSPPRKRKASTSTLSIKPLGGRGVRQHLVVKSTTLANPTLPPSTRPTLPMLGLFTTHAIPLGGFVGFYTGEFEDAESLTATSYTVHISDYKITPPSVQGTVNPFLYPIAMANEPPPHVPANVFMMEWSKAGDMVPGLERSDDADGAVIHALRPIAAGEELFINYGVEYSHRSKYPKWARGVGPGAHLPRKSIPPAERPRAYLVDVLGEAAPLDGYA